jgi:PAS domain S-box-containing protein
MKISAPICFVGKRSLEPGGVDAQLVRIRGTLIDQSTSGTDRVLTLQKGSLIFTAQLELPAEDDAAPSIQDGSLLQLTGVWSVETDKYRRPTAFSVSLRSARNIEVIKHPSRWTAARILALLAILGGTILLGALWVIHLRRRVDERTETVRATLESTADGILVIDSAGKVAAYNRKFSEMWHIPESVLNARDDRKLLDCAMTQVKDPEQFLAKVQELHADREAHTDDIVECKDGRIFERHSEPQRVKDRSVGRVWGFRDVTDQRRAQNALKRSEERVRLLFASVPHPILVYNLESLELFEVNDRAVADYGYTRKEFQYMRVSDLLLTEEIVLPAQETPGLRAASRATSEWQIKTKSGQVVDAEVSRAALQHDGRRAALVIALDITERKRVQEEREKLIFQLKQALSKVKQLSGMLPICACCKKVRDDSGYWKQIEGYLVEHSDAVFSHAICPQCMDRHYPEYSAEENEDGLLPGVQSAG